MLDRIISQTQLLALVDEMARTRKIVGPVKRDDRHLYEVVDRASKLDLDFRYCVFSPKAFLFPPEESLFVFKRTNGTFSAEPKYDETPLALVGVHPCDINAVRLLDRVFSADVEDEHYLARRRNTFIIGVDCAKPCTEGVFCRDMGSFEAATGFDVLCYPLAVESAAQGVRYGVVFGTEAGREFILYSRAGTAPTADDERLYNRYLAEKRSAFPQTLPHDVHTLPQLLDHSYDSLLWEATARRCYSCGSCNLVCPTCYCFNMSEKMELGGVAGQRMREWDGCQLKAFAEVAGGHNFRAKAGSRLRHRIYRKGKWIMDRTELPGCVGCARCDRACTAKISIVEIYNQLAEET